MAADLAQTPVSGFRAQTCGDAHLSNFGLFASAERKLVFDVNDFDETLPAPWEWDVKRLAASLAVADWKGSAIIEEQQPSGMAIYASICGWTLARAHARSGDRIAIAAYLGSSDRFDNAVADFAEAYADLNEEDFAALQSAVRDGSVQVQTGM